MSKKPRFWSSEITSVDGSRLRLDSISGGIKPMLGTTQHVFSAEITTPFEETAQVGDVTSVELESRALLNQQIAGSIMGSSLATQAAVDGGIVPASYFDHREVHASAMTDWLKKANDLVNQYANEGYTVKFDVKPRDEFVPRLAHCHPSHRWTRREDDSVELWCACGAQVNRVYQNVLNVCERHCPALSLGMIYPGSITHFASDVIDRAVSEGGEAEYQSPRTEQERCEWAGVEYLEPEYEQDDPVVMGFDLLGRLEQHRRHTAKEKPGVGSDIVRHFGFGQDPHE